LLSVTSHAQWQKLEGCRLIDDKANDGDSFHVRHQGKEYIFRLYFADAPETDHTLDDRVQEQAAFWSIPPKSVLRMGKEAGRYTESQLRGEFTVFTEMQDAKGDSGLPRSFAFVTTRDGEDLAGRLIENGLARLYGAQADHPAGRPASTMWEYLGSLQKKAREGGLGCWAPALK